MKGAPKAGDAGSGDISCEYAPDAPSRAGRKSLLTQAGIAAVLGCPSNNLLAIRHRF